MEEIIKFVVIDEFKEECHILIKWNRDAFVTVIATLTTTTTTRKR